jgi:hypothetical protein
MIMISPFPKEEVVLAIRALINGIKVASADNIPGERINNGMESLI